MSYKWIMLISCCIVFSHYHAARMLIYPVLPVLKEEFHLSYTGLGLLSSGYDIGYGLTLLLGGYLADRFNRKYLICLGLLWLSVLKVLTGFSSSPAQLVLFRVLTGMSFGTYFGAGLSLIAESFQQRERGKAMGIHGMAAGLGRAVTIPLTGALIVRLGWRSPFFLFSLFAFSASILFWFLAEEPRLKRSRDGLQTAPTVVLNQKRFLDLLKSPMLIMVGLLHCLTIACAVGEGPFLILYMIDIYKLSLTYASTLIGLYQITGILLALAATSLSDIYGRKKPLLCAFTISAISYYLFVHIGSGIWLIFLIIFGFGYIFAATMILQTVMADVAPEEIRGMAFGYMNTWGVITGFIANPALGYISDLFGLKLVFIVMAMIAFICIPLTIKLRVK